MNTLDIILLLPLLYGLVRGLFRGLVKELTAIVAIIAAVVCAKLLAPNTAQLLDNYLNLGETACLIIAYVVIFLIVAVILNIFGNLISKLLKSISLGWVNRLLGAVFGTLKWALIVSVLLNGVDMADEYLHFIQPEVKQQSVVYQPIKQIASVAWQGVQQFPTGDPQEDSNEQPC